MYKNFTFSFIGVVVLSANFFSFQNSIIGILGGISYIYGITFFLLPWFQKKNEPVIDSYPYRVMAGLVLFCILSLIGSILYLIHALNTTALFIMLITPLCSIPLVLHTKKYPIHDDKLNPLPRFLKLYSGLAIIIDVALLANIFINRTWDVTPSPWQNLGPSFFFLYLIGTALVIALSIIIKDHSIKYIITSLHLFVTYGVAALMYPLGFGFDGFTHRATETWIAQHGFILPKIPLYIGQYVVIVFLQKFTAIRLFFLDVYFVPVLASLFLPVFFDQCGKKVFSAVRGSIATVWWLPFIYFFTFNLTTPFNILLIFTIIGILTLKQYFVGQGTIVVPLLVAISGLFIHPLLAAPLLLFTITGWCLKNNKKIKPLLILYFVACTFTVPILFMAYIYATKHIVPTLTNPFTQLNLFFNYFRAPYWYAPDASWYWQILYRGEWLIPLVVIVVSAIGFIKDKSKTLIDYLFPLTTLAFWFGGFFLRSWVVFPDVHAMEQGDYPLRLLKTGLLFLLPWGIYSFVLMGKKMGNFIQDRIDQKMIYVYCLALLLGISFLLTLSFYLSYPQRNQKVSFPGYNVSDSDFKAVAWIHADNTDYNYVVLSNPITAMAALQNYGFAKYFSTSQGQISYYSVPSGGPFFSLYTEMWREGQKKETMIKAMNLVGVHKAYFIIPSYWTRFSSIVEGAKKTADQWVSIDEGKIFIFVYKK